MHSRNSVFNKKYYIYSLIRILPYAGAMAAVLAVLNLLIFGLARGLSSLYGFNADALSGTASFMIDVMPVLLSVGLFNFLYKKKKSDFFGAAPVSRLCLFFTNIVVGVTIIVGILLINLVSMILISHFAYPGIAAALPAFVYSFFAMLTGWLAAFGAASLCATVSGGVISHLVLTGLLMFLPAVIALLVQYPVFQFIGQPSSYVENAEAVMFNTFRDSGMFFFPSFYSEPLQSGLMLFMSSGSSSLPGLAEKYTELWRILYNFGLFVVFTLGGCIFIKKRPFETAERPYVRDILTDIVLAAAFLPGGVLGVVVLLHESVAGIVILCLISMMFIGCSLILRKGFAKILRATASLGLCLAVSLGAALALDAVARENENTLPYLIAVKPDDIVSAQVCMTPLDVVGPASVDIPIDAQTVKAIFKATNSSSGEELSYYAGDINRLEITVSTEDGSSCSGFFSLNSRASGLLFDYIESHEDAKRELEKYAALPSLSTSFIYSGEGVALDTLEDEKIQELLAQRQKLTIADRYARLSNCEDMLPNSMGLLGSFFSWSINTGRIVNCRYIGSEYYYDILGLEDININDALVDRIENSFNGRKTIEAEDTIIFINTLFATNTYETDPVRSHIFERAVQDALNQYSAQIVNDLKAAPAFYSSFEDLFFLELNFEGRAGIKRLRYFVDFSDFIEKYALQALSAEQIADSFSPEDYMYVDLANISSGEYILSIFQSDMYAFILDNPDCLVTWKSGDEALAGDVYAVYGFVSTVYIKDSPELQRFLEKHSAVVVNPHEIIVN